MRVDAGCRWLGAVVALLLLLLLLAGPVRAQSSGNLPEPVGRSIQALLAQKARRTPAQRKLSSQLLDAAESAQAAGSDARRQARDADAKDEIVTVDIRADVTSAVLARIRALGGTVINSVPKYRAIRAQLPVTAIERLAALAAVQTIRPADEAVTRKDNTTQGDVAHRATVARTTHRVDGTGIGIGVISDGVRTLAARQASGDVPAQVTVLPGQAGAGDEGTALLEIVYDLAPGADLYFATGNGGQARMAANIEALCEAGANVIVDDIGYLLESAFQDDIVAQGVNAAVADGCVFFSAGGNDGNLTHGTSGVWEGDYAAGSALVVDGQTVGTKHDFGGGVEANELEGRSVRTIILQWADPLGDSSNDYDLFLVNENGAVLASSTDTQDGTQDPIEIISSPIFTYSGLSVVVVKASGANRYLRVQAHSGPLAVATAGTLYGHSAQENAISVAMVDVATAGGSGGVFDGTESVRSSNSDGPRRIFFEADGTAITSGNFSATGGKLLQKPDLTAASCVTTATPGFSRFCGTSAAAPHAAAIGALMLEAAGGPEQVTLAQLRTAMTGAALDIEATGVDRDSGAGIVMAPGAVDAVDVAVADRNAAPTVSSAQNNRTFAAGAAAPPINLATVFSDPDATDTLTYEAVSSDPDRLAVTRSDAMVTLTPGSPGRAVVTLRAIDPDGLSAVETFSVLVTAGNRDYDADNDGLIDVGNLAQLDAMRYDLNGDGLVDGATWMPYYVAFPMGAPEMGCPADGCTGYELTGNLDFDTNGDGRADMVGDTYWNAGAGWEPIGDADDPFTADFEGDGHTIANLFIDRETEDGVGLFGASNRSAMRGVGLTGVDVTGDDRVGSLLGHSVYATVIDSSATGRVSGQDEVGGLVGRTWGRVRHSYAAVNVSGADAVGGLVGHQLLNDLDSSYATGNVEGMNAVGGLVGAVSDRYQVIWASYATGDVSGGGARLSESDSGFIICDGLGFFTTFGPVETPTSSGGGVGGLVGSSCGVIEASYATGAVSGDVAVGGLVGSGQSVRVRAGYWDLETSGVRVGVGEDDENDNGVIDGTESQRLGVGGKTTAELQTPTDYTGIYAAWNVDLWNFGTSTQYPALSLDLNDDNRATWQEFGYQVRDGLTLTATTTESQAQVVLSWNAVSTSPWNPDPPDVSYTLYRDDGTTVEAIAENLTGRTHTDTDVTIDDDYTYWVAAVVDGGEAARSAPVVVIAGKGNQPPVAVGIVADRELLVGATAVVVDVAGAFDDPDADTLTYAASSSVTSVATLSRSGSMITITPASAGRTIITVTATDAGGSNTSVSQRFTVTVGHDYDTDKDGLIAISNLAQLHAMRHDLDGNGVPVSAGSAAYAAAFPDAFARLGCGIDGCSGYELTKDLDFDTDGDGSADAGDTYWNAGEGWEPIGLPRGRIFGILLGAFNATFDGNGHSIANLFVARDDHSGLFGAIRSRGAVRDVRLTDVDVTGKQHVGGLAGENHGVVSRVQSAGQVSGEVQVGGLVGGNLGTITLARSSAAVTGMAPPDFVRTSDLDRGTGGLVGYNGGAVRGSYATGRVVGDSNVGGLVGWNFNDGFVGAARSHASIVGSYATGSVAGRSSVGGLVGTNGIPGNAPFVLGEIKASYATGRVSGPARGVGGLVGYDSGDDSTIITASYWDTNTSGQTSGSFGIGKTTAQLKAPTGYSGIYGSWNVDLDDDGRNDDPWHFVTSSQYPVLKANVDGQGTATWQEFGYQLRSGPTLMTPTVTPTMTPGQAQVALEWTAVEVDAGSWTPPPDVTYTVTRADGDTVEILEEGLEVLLYTDSAARTGATLSYQVIAVVDGGEPVRSATVVVNTSGNSPPLPVGTLPDRWLHAGDAAGVEVGKAFEDPEGDTLTYTAASSATGVVTVSVSGSRVTLTPVAAGTATITVTATDAGGSMAGGTQTLTVTVQPSSAFDYDTDDDGLIEITTLARLDAIRHDLNGDGVPTTDGATAYAVAFSTVGDRQACGGLTGCVGYELADNLDFDTDDDGDVDSDDDYWNAGAGWEPIKAATTPGVAVIGADFRAIFEGNGYTIANLFIDRDSDVGLFGRTAYGSVIRHVGLIDVMVSGSSNVGGLAGTANGSVIGSYVTGTVTGTGEDVGGLAGATWGSLVVASYAAVEVTGRTNVGGLIGENDAAVTASYATGWVAGDDNVGGLVGSNGRTITASYATGPVTGVRNVGGLVGRNTRSFGFTGTVTTSYWDTTTSRRTTSAGGQGRTTGQLQTPTGYSGIYAQWNVDLDGDGEANDPWHFDTGKYPALQVNGDGQGADWKKFGYQLRAGPTLTATGSATQVDLSWTAVDTRPWNPDAPAVTYIVYRNSGSTVSVVAENISGLQHTTTGVTDRYQVSAVVTGGEAVRSRWGAVVAAPNQPPTFDEGNSAMRSVPENTPAGRAIGMPVVASDADNDPRTYSLGGDNAADFSINTSTGQLRTKARVTYDYEAQATYRVTVSVHDGKAADHTSDTSIDTSIDVTITLTDVNDPARFPSTETGSRSVNENTPAGRDIGDPVEADDDDGDSRTYSLSGTDAASFTIGVFTGQLQTKDGVTYDYETPKKSYRVTVSVRDSKNDEGDPDTATDDTVTVTINVGNVDEAGMVTLMGTPPQELQQLTAALSDPDGGPRGITWQWARSANSTGPWTNITGATAMRYPPGATDLGQYLQATATYTDDQGSGKRASQATTTSVQAAPKVKLSLSDTSISEDGTESSTVTASLDRVSSENTTVTVSAPTSDVTLSGSTLTIAKEMTASTGTVTLTAKPNNMDAPDKTVQVRGMTNNRLVADPDPVDLEIVDDDVAPTVELLLTPPQISENKQVSTVTAMLSHASSEDTEVEVSAVAVPPAAAGDFALSPNTTLTIPAGDTASSRPAVTLTSVDNNTDAPNKQVTVSGRATNTQGIARNPANATLSITDDDPAPTATLTLSDTQIDEDGGQSTLTVTLSHPSSEETTVTVSADPAEAVTLSPNPLTIRAGATEGTVTVTAENNDIDGPERQTVTISADAENDLGVTDPPNKTLTIEDDDNPPEVTLAVSENAIDESGVDNNVTVTATLNRASSTQIVVTVATDPKYTPSAPRTLTIPAGKRESESEGNTVTLTAVDNDIDAEHAKVSVGGTTRPSGLTVKAAELTIRDDDTRGVTVSPTELTVIEGSSDTFTYTVVLKSEPTAPVTITVESSDAAVSVNPSSPLKFRTNNWDDEQTVRVSAGEDLDAADDTATITHTVSTVSGGDYEGETADAVDVTVEDDEAEATAVTLTVNRTVPESNTGTVVRVTGTLNGAPKQYETVVQVTVTADTADLGDFNAVSPFDLTIAAGRERGTEDFTLTPVNDLMDEPPETVTVDGSATVRDGSSIVERLDVNGTTVTIEDNDDPPTLTLELSADSITESGVDNRTTVRAVLNHPSSEVTTVDVSAAAVPPAVAADFTLSGTSLTIGAGATESIGGVTLTARNNPEDEADKQVTVTGRATNTQGLRRPTAEVTVTITDDDPPEVEGDSDPEYVEGGTGPVATYTASNPDPRNISIRWGLEGADKDAFTISNGVLRFTASPDYEDPNNLDNEYAVTVQATASDEPLPGPLDVTVTIEDALGMVRLSSNQPQLGRELTATLHDDPDEVDTATTEWCWERSLLPAFPPTDTDRIACAFTPTTTATYTPVADDLGYYLRATARYTDGRGTAKPEPAAGGTTGTVSARRRPPPPPPPPPPGRGGGGPACAEDLHGNSAAQSTDIALSVVTAGAICPAADVDYFTVTVPGQGLIFVDTTRGVPTRGTIWQDGTVLATGPTGRQPDDRLGARVQAGPIVVAVQGQGGATGTYAVEITFTPGYLENPGADSFQSGVGILSGWVCEAAVVEIELNGMPQEAAYGTERLDTAGVCGDTDNGFGLLFNWNLLRDGEHKVVALVDGVELGRATVMVTTLGEEFLRGVTGTCEAEDFPTLGERVTLVWQQNSQNFVIAEGSPPVGATPGRSSAVAGFLENPGHNSFQSGVRVLSGWVCDADTVELAIGTAGRQVAAYGTERLDTAGVCGDTDNGFGLLFNWNLLGEGEHEVVAFVDDVELGRATVRVTTLGEEFLRGAEGECVVDDFPRLGQSVLLEWQQNSQNFVVTDVE